MRLEISLLLHSILLASVTLAQPVRAESGKSGGEESGIPLEVNTLFEEYCLDCHDADVQKGGLSLEGLDPDFFRGDDVETWRGVEEALKFRDMPPRQKDQPPEQDRERAIAWIRSQLLRTQMPGVMSEERLRLPRFGNLVDHRALFGSRRSHVTPAPPRIWRLRPSIYESLMEGMADRIGPLANGLNLDDGPDFRDHSAGYFVDEAAARTLLGNARSVAAAMLSPSTRDRALRRLVAPDPPGKEHVLEAIEAVFRKTLGRAPHAEERERFASFHEEARREAGHELAARALLTAILMQPEVLFRQELGEGPPDDHGRVRLAPRELAFALSFALDDQLIGELLQAASSGKLNDRTSVTRLLRERLRDDSLLQDRNPRLLLFFREYFHYPFARDVFKDRPEGGIHEPGLLVEDLETTIRDVLREDRQVLATLLTTRRYHVNARYREVKNEGVLLKRGHDRKWPYPTSYNLPLDWKWAVEEQPVDFPGEERAGVLTHPAWLAAWSGNFENHPVQRGQWIRTHLLGGSVPDVPIGVDARVPEDEHRTFRDRLVETTKKPECWRCHRKMDPLGLVFEQYDHYGRFRRLENGLPVDPSGAITRTGIADLEGEVSGPTALLDRLAGSEHVEQVFVRHVFRFFLGRNETLGDANTLQDAHRAYRESGGSFRELVVSLLSSDSFLLRQLPETLSSGENP